MNPTSTSPILRRSRIDSKLPEFLIEFQKESGKLGAVRSTNCLAVSVSLLLLFSAVCEARPVIPLFPEELEPKASLICNGTVLSIEKTEVKKDFVYLNGLLSAPEMVM